MKLLAVETATTRLSVAVLNGAQVMARIDADAQGRHGKLLVPAIDAVFNSSKVTLSDLQGLAVSIGPGSFTGLRVGLATVLGFRMVTGLPLVTVPTLEAMAWNLHGYVDFGSPQASSAAAKSRRNGLQSETPVERTLCPVLRARTGEVYWALYRWTDSGTLMRVGEERVGSFEAMVQSLDGPVVVFGEGWKMNMKELRRLCERRRVLLEEGPSVAHSASAVSVGLAGLERLARGEVAGTGISPRYIQRAEAELMMERRTAGACSL